MNSFYFFKSISIKFVVLLCPLLFLCLSFSSRKKFFRWSDTLIIVISVVLSTNNKNKDHDGADVHVSGTPPLLFLRVQTIYPASKSLFFISCHSKIYLYIYKTEHEHDERYNNRDKVCLLCSKL